MRRLIKTLLATVSASVLAVGLAGPALASNEVRVKLDPLGSWEWSGKVEVYNTRDCVDDLWDHQDPTECLATPGARNALVGETTFDLGPGGGPQQVYTLDVFDGQARLVSVTGELTANGETVPSGLGYLWIVDPSMNWMKGTQVTNIQQPAGAVPVEASWSKQEDPTTGQNFYELKFFPTQEAPAPNADALMNLHRVQSEGVDTCDVAVTAEPGDVVSGTDGDDTVCVTVEDGKSDDPIAIETGAGDDVVLVEGDTDATVVVDAGGGDDVVVADTDANVVVDAGDGADAVAGGGNTVAAFASAATAVVGSAQENTDSFGGDCLTDADLEGMDGKVDLAYDADTGSVIVKQTGEAVCE